MNRATGKNIVATKQPTAWELVNMFPIRENESWKLFMFFLGSNLMILFIMITARRSEESGRRNEG